MKIKNKTSLHAAIRELEIKRKFQEEELIEQFKVTRESLKPANLVLGSIRQFAKSGENGGNLIKSFAGIALSMLSGNLIMGKSPALVKNLLSGVLGMAVANTTTSSLDKVKAYGISLYKNIFRKNSAVKLKELEELN